jgi:uncharacterized membrane protein (UPF0136 family)
MGERTPRRNPLRPTTIIALLSAVIIGIALAVAGLVYFVNRDHGMPWFFWAAPLLVLAFGFTLLALSRGYWMQVGKLETRGRPTSG